MKSIIKKIIVIAAILAILLVGYGIDSIIASTYSIDFVSVERVNKEIILDDNGNEIPLNVGICDGKTQIEIKAKVTKNNNPIANHILYVKTNRNIIGRLTTNENGEIDFEYRCYLANTASDVVFTITDEDNSLFVFVPATKTYTLKMVALSSKSSSNMTTNDIFFDLN